MKKSNKLSFFYISACLSLLGLLIFGGCYGIYVSVGLNFVRSSVSNLAESGTGATNVSYGGTVNFNSNMTGVIILSIILVVLAVLDIVSLVKQVTLFKQFSVVKDSKLAEKIGKKNKSKGAVVFFAALVDVLSLAAGVVGIFVNLRSFNGGNYVFLLYFIDAAVAVLSLISIVLLIVKYKRAKRSVKKTSEQDHSRDDQTGGKEQERKLDINFSDDLFSAESDTSEIDRLENRLLKLKYLRSSRLISEEEFIKLREKFLMIKSKNSEDEPEEDT